MAVVTAILAAVLASAGCAGRDGDDGDIRQDGGTVQNRSGDADGTSSSQVPPSSAATPTGPPTAPSDALRKVRITGTVTASSLECVEVVDDSGLAWSLIGSGERPADGTRVSATGVPRAVPERAAAPAESCAGTPVQVTDFVVHPTTASPS